MGLLPLTKKNKLSHLEFDEISVVPSGDNPPAHIVLAKADPEVIDKGKKKPPADDGDGADSEDDTDAASEEDAADGGADDGSEDAAGKKKKGKVKKSVKQYLLDLIESTPEDEDIDKNTLAKFAGGTLSGDNHNSEETVTTDNDSTTEIDLSKMDPDVREYIELLKAENDELLDIVADLADDGDEGSEFSDESDADVLAKADPAIQELISKQEARIAEAEGIAKAERDHRIRQEMISKASALPHVIGSLDEKADMIAKAYEVSDEYGQQVEQSLKAMNAQIAKSDLFTEYGAGGAGSNSEVDSMVAELRKADPSLTIEQATDTVYKNNPSLYEQEGV